MEYNGIKVLVSEGAFKEYKNEELIEYFNYDANFNELLKILKGE